MNEKELKKDHLWAVMITPDARDVMTPLMNRPISEDGIIVIKAPLCYANNGALYFAKENEILSIFAPGQWIFVEREGESTRLFP